MKITRFKHKFHEYTSVLRSEYRNIFNDAGVLLIAVGAIFIYSMAYSLAYKNEVLRDIPVAVVDNSHTPSSRQLIRAFDATPNIDVAYKPTSLEEAKKLFFERKVYGVIVIPSDFEKKLMRTEKVNIAIYADASYFLMYRQVFFDFAGSLGQSNYHVKWLRFVSKGASTKQADALSSPVVTSVHNLYNPYLGYATFIMPAILLVIIQQTLLIGIGMVGGTWREKKLYRTLIPTGQSRMSVFPIVLGKSTAFISIYCITITYLLTFHYKLFGYPVKGDTMDLILFLIPYLLSCTFLGIAVSTLFKHRENSLLLLLFTSIPVLMLSGASVPSECIPTWLFNGAKIIPSSSGVDGFLRIQTMGATLAEVATQFRTLWILTGVYFILACVGMRRVLRKTENESSATNQ